MNTDNAAQTFDHTATYSPQDDKIRLFFGYKLPRDQWDALRAAGWVWTMKQDSDMVAKWTPEREDEALALCGEIGDEDQPREERAAERAERFEGYQDKRMGEAVGLADRYDAGPRVHGHQDQRRAERSAARHDRVAGRAVAQWGKAEYWQRRTAGVIAHAMHLEEPAVRFRRIKGYEADLRALEVRTDARGIRYADHLRLLLAYERQMLAAQGGAGLTEVEMVPGGWIGTHQVQKLSKDKAGRVSKVFVLAPTGANFDRRGKAYDESNPRPMTLRGLDAENIRPGAYRAPTAEELAAFRAANKARNAAAPKAPPLMNPTDDDAMRLQMLWNLATDDQRKRWGKEPAKVRHTTQATYSAASKGSYARAETIEVRAGGMPNLVDYFRPVARFRVSDDGVVVLTDKPRTALPAGFWDDALPGLKAATALRIVDIHRLAHRAWCSDLDKVVEVAGADKLWQAALVCGLAHQRSSLQFGLTDEGVALARAAGCYGSMVTA